MNPPWSLRLYRFLLRFYPQRVRERFGRDMSECFEDQLASVSGSRLTDRLFMGLRVFAEVPFSALWAHGEALRERPRIEQAGGAHRARHTSGRKAGAMDGVLKDLLYAIRGLRRRPALTALAVLSLALGIGVNTTMLGMVDSLLWNRLPVPEPAEIVRVFQMERGEFQRFSYANYRDLREFGADVFEDLFIHRLETFGLQGRGSSEVVYGELVSASYFDTLAIGPAVGRLFSFPGPKVHFCRGHRDGC